MLAIISGEGGHGGSSSSVGNPVRARFRPGIHKPLSVASGSCRRGWVRAGYDWGILVGVMTA